MVFQHPFPDFGNFPAIIEKIVIRERLAVFAAFFIGFDILKVDFVKVEDFPQRRKVDGHNLFGRFHISRLGRSSDKEVVFFGRNVGIQKFGIEIKRCRNIHSLIVDGQSHSLNIVHHIRVDFDHLSVVFSLIQPITHQLQLGYGQVYSGIYLSIQAVERGRYRFGQRTHQIPRRRPVVGHIRKLVLGISGVKSSQGFGNNLIGHGI